MNNRLQHAAIILAAGASRRLGTPKQLVSINNETLLNRTLRLASSTHPAQLLLVLGYRADEIYASVKHNVERVECLDWQTGMSASLRAGLQHVNADCAGALIMLCDQTSLSDDHLKVLLETWMHQPGCAVASGYGDEIGVPAFLPRSWFAELNDVRGDQGARQLLRSRSDVIQIAAPDLVHDIDFVHELPTNFS